jgi:transposase
VPELRPNQVVIIDNASFHKSSRTRTLIEEAECQLLFLPPYSPDLNKIEKFWARLKRYLRRTLDQFEHLWDAVDCAFNALS